MTRYRIPGLARLGEPAAPSPEQAAQVLALALAREMYGPEVEAPPSYLLVRPNGAGSWVVRASAGPIENGVLVAQSLCFAIVEIDNAA